MKIFKNIALFLGLTSFAILISSSGLQATACDALVSVDDAQDETGTGAITVQITDLTLTHNVLIWTPSGDIAATEVSTGIWIMDNLVPSDEYMAMVFAYDTNGNEICEVHYATPIAIIEENTPIDVCACTEGILDNFSFENGTSAWEVSSDDDFFSTNGYEECEAKYGLLDWDNGFEATVEQVIENISEGAMFDLEFYAGTHITSYDHWVRLAFYDANNTLLSYIQIDVNHDVDTDNGNLFLYSAHDIEAPTSTSYLKLEGFANGNYLKLDAICLMMEEPVGDISGSVYKNQTEVDDFGNIQATSTPTENAFIMLTKDDGTAYSTMTDANGEYIFVDIPVGNYTVTAPEPMDGYSDYSDFDYSDDGDANDLNDPADNKIPVTLLGDELDADNNFIDQADSGTITGSVTIDTNNDNIGEDTFEEVMLKLCDPNGQIAVDIDGNNIENVVTDAMGIYSFANLAIGNYVVKECQPTGFSSVADGDESPDGDVEDGILNNDDQISVSLLAGETDSDNNFVDEASVYISGSVMEDVDNDDLGDLPLENVEFKLMDATGNPAFDLDGNLVASSFSDNTGYFEFSNISDGVYFIEQIQPDNYSNVWAEDTSDDDAVDILDYDLLDNLIPIFLEPGEGDINNDFVEETECDQAEPNTYLTVGVITNPGIIGSSTDIVNVTYVLINTGTDALSEVELNSEVTLFNGEPIDITLNPVFAGDPNNNGYLDPNEIWFYSAVNTFTYGEGDSFIVGCGASANSPCASEIGGAADLLFTSGVNMDVEIEQEYIQPGESIDITLTTRLLIDEDVSKSPGSTTIMVDGTPIDVALPRAKWNARDLRISATGINNNEPFNPFNPPNGLELLTFCDQGGFDGGRNNEYVLDEFEPIETVRTPCESFGENDVQCEFPDWVFCYKLAIPSNYNQATFEVTASDDFSVWVSRETKGGSGEFKAYEEITEYIESGGSDTDQVQIKQLHALTIDKIEAKKIYNTTELTWTTSHENINCEYYIERSSDKINFETIGKVNGNGTTLSLNSYLFTDTNPLPFKNFYRVFQVDSNGMNSTSEIRSVDFGSSNGENNFLVYPNPVVDYAVFRTGSENENIKVAVYNGDGTKVIETVINSGERLNLSDLAPGQYVAKATNQSTNQFFYEKITVIR